MSKGTQFDIPKELLGEHQAKMSARWGLPLKNKRVEDKWQA